MNRFIDFFMFSILAVGIVLMVTLPLSAQSSLPLVSGENVITPPVNSMS